MIAWKLKLWRTAGAAAVIGLAACGDGGDAKTESTQTTASPPAASGEAGEAAIGESGGERGGATAAAYAGVSGDALTALRLQHLKGYVIAAQYITEGDRPVDAGALVTRGLHEVYDAAPDQFGALDIAIIRAATNGQGLNRAQMMQRLRDAEHAIEAAAGQLRDIDHAALAARMVDITTGLYQQAAQSGTIDPALYSASRGAAFAARDALTTDQDALRRESFIGYGEAEAAMNRLVDMYPGVEPGRSPPTYAQILAQGSRIRLALSPFL